MSKSPALEAQPARRVRSETIGPFAVLFAAACWGTSGVFVKLLTTDVGVSALALAFWRDLSTFLLLLTGTGLFQRGRLRVQRHELGWLVAMGSTLGVFHVFWNLGVFLNGAAIATVQQAAMPAIVALAAWLIWREPLTWVKILAILLTFAGTVLVSRLGMLAQSEVSLGGFIVGLGIPVTYAAWTLLGKKVRATCNPLTLLTYVFGFAALVLLPFQFFTPQPWPAPSSAWLWFAGLVCVSTILGFVVFTFALGSLQASVASILAMSEIAFVAIYAYVLLDERLVVSQILGAGLVILGMVLLYLRSETSTAE